MESLTDTTWDVLIEGTGLQNSLLALALSRSNKKILHIDQNEYYGGAEAAFSLQEVDEWVPKVNGDSSPSFRNASLWKTDVKSPNANENLSFSRAYSLSLSPQIIYTRSKLLSRLISSKVYKQIEFQAVGNWWVYDGESQELRRLPNGREDIFQDKSIDNRAKRSLMKFLKFVVDFENQTETWQPHADSGLAGFLSSKFQLPSNIHTIIAALTLSLEPADAIPVKWALPRIARHLTSIGLFGPGFGAVVPKWGGCSEIAQVACRAGAVGGAVYMLGTGVKSSEVLTEGDETLTNVHLSNSDTIKAKLLVGKDAGDSTGTVSKLIAVVSSPLTSLFESSVEGSPRLAISIAVFPPNTTVVGGLTQTHPVYVMMHSSDVGECPAGQCVLYATTFYTESSKAILEACLSTFLKVSKTEQEKLLYTLYYEQTGNPEISLDLASNDKILEEVEEQYNKIMGGSNDEFPPAFMIFEDRQGMNGDEEDEAY